MSSDRLNNVRRPGSGVKLGSRGAPVNLSATVQAPNTVAGRSEPVSQANVRLGRAIPRSNQPAGSLSVVENKQISQHAAVRPSVLTSHPTISSGSQDFDKLLGHMGIPLGSLILVQETGPTDFSSALLRACASQGIIHQRLSDNSGPTKVVVVGSDESWGRELPGVYSSRKEADKKKIKVEESKISVSNLSQDTERTKGQLKIAWRYGMNNPAKGAILETPSAENYISQLQFTSRLSPLATGSEISFITPKRPPFTETSFFAHCITQLNGVVQEAVKSNQIIRVLIPSLLHPAIYPINCYKSSEIIPFFVSLRSLLRSYPHNIVVMISMSLDMFSRHESTTRWIELLSDGIFHLDPFPDKLEVDEEPNATNNKPFQGLINTYKLPIISERGAMVLRRGEQAFRLSRKQFEIEDWGIPIEDHEGKQEEKTNSLEF